MRFMHISALKLLDNVKYRRQIINLKKNKPIKNDKKGDRWDLTRNV
jgi:hypothetical protein